jgi:hypothetical protein
MSEAGLLQDTQTDKKGSKRRLCAQECKAHETQVVLQSNKLKSCTSLKSLEKKGPAKAAYSQSK